MHMRRLILAACGIAALAAAGVAVANGIGDKSIKSLTASFTATTVSDSRTRTCTNADGSWVLTKARYGGTSTSADADLNGPVTFTIESLINTTKNLGTLRGRGSVDVSGRDTTFKLDAVYSTGKANGLLAGQAHEPSERILGNVSFDFSSTGGLTNGKIGDTAGGGAAVDLERGRCEPGTSAAEKVEARGTVSAVSSTSITVAGVTCVVPSELASKVGSLAVGDEVRITCRRQDSQLVLTKVDKKKKKK